MSIKEYLTFTKRERYGILTLVIILLIVVFLPQVIPKPKVKLLPASVTQQLLDKKYAAGDSFRTEYRRPRYGEQEYRRREDQYGIDRPDSTNHERSYNASRHPYYHYQRDVEWSRRYGRDKREKIAGGAYRADGWYRRRYYAGNGDKRDFKKISADNGYGHSDRGRGQSSGNTFYGNNYEEGKSQAHSEEKRIYREYTARFAAFHKPKYRPVDINTADTTAFIGLPGIGSKLAARIVSFRKKLGGFTGVEQIREVYGLRDSVFVMLKPYLICDSAYTGERNLGYNTNR